MTIQIQELAALQQYADSRGFDDTIREFDVAFFRRKQARTVFGVEEEEVRDFFPLPRVLAGIFSLLEEHFGLQFELVEEQGSGAWSQEVSLYRVKEGEQVLGHVYLDPYLREDKAYQGGDRGWYIPIRSATSGSCGTVDTMIHRRQIRQ